MAEAAKTVEVQLLGRTYRVACEDNEREALMQAVGPPYRKMHRNSRARKATTLFSQGSGAEPTGTSGGRFSRAKEMNYWLMKSEPDECSIDEVLAAPGQKTAWSGVRNYTARNFMRDKMRIGDAVFFYHSSCPEPGIAGIAEVASAPYTDASQFDRKSPYYDAGSKK